MKITQITSTDAVNEAPGGSAIGNIARKVGAKVAGGSGARTSGMTGKVDANKRAKEIFTQYRQYMGQTGGNQSTSNQKSYRTPAKTRSFHP